MTLWNNKVVVLIGIAVLLVGSAIVVGRSDKATSGSSASTLVRVETHGGLCSSGQECRSTTTIRTDGSVDGSALSVDTDKLKYLIESTNYNELRSSPFTGLCPTAYDGSEVTYTFFTSHGEERLASCSYDLNTSVEPFVETDNLIKQVDGA